jgi:uridine phosphorylase
MPRAARYCGGNGQSKVKARSKNPTNRLRTNLDQPVADTRTASPLLELDAARVAIIEPSRFIEPIDIAEHCVLCFFQEVIAELVREGARARHLHTGQSEVGDYPVYELDYGGRRLAVVHPGVGAPAAAARFERVIALGCRKFIVCGGVLDGAINVGDIVVPSSAIRDEGASHHYLRPAREVAPTRRALAAIEAVLRENHHDYVRGKTWTTDAVYRETRQRMNRRRGEGCVVVDMEAAAFFAVARFRRVECAQILYGGDSLAGRRWDPRMESSRDARATVSTRRPGLPAAVSPARPSSLGPEAAATPQQKIPTSA